MLNVFDTLPLTNNDINVKEKQIVKNIKKKRCWALQKMSISILTSQKVPLGHFNYKLMFD